MHLLQEVAAALLALSIAVDAYLIAPPAPTETSANELDGNGWSPKPTQAPLGKAWGAMDVRQLFGRDSPASQTCGYINGIASKSLTCGTGFGCAYVNSIAYGPICCETDTAGSITGDCPGATVCEPYHNTIGQYNGSNIVTTSLAVWCPSALPNCFTWLFNEVVGGGSTRYYSVYDCTPTGLPTLSEVLVSTNGGTISATSVSSLLSSATALIGSSTPPGSPITASNSSTSPSATTPTSAPSSSPTSLSPVSSTSSPASQSSTTTPTPQPSHTGAIAGGVVGGVAAIALVIGTIVYLMRRKSQQRKEVLPEISQYAAR